jgi:hypothetical protein
MYDDADAPEGRPAPEEPEAPADDGTAGRHAGDGDVETTGHPAVDAVLASLDGLDEHPVGEHVAVFESAHDALRRALNDAGEG